MDDKFITKEYAPTREFPKSNDYPRSREYTPSGDFPRSREYPTTGSLEQDDDYEYKKPRGKFARFLHFVFVKNIGLKIAALVTAGVLLALVAGIG